MKGKQIMKRHFVPITAEDYHFILEYQSSVSVSCLWFEAFNSESFLPNTLFFHFLHILQLRLVTQRKDGVLHTCSGR